MDFQWDHEWDGISVEVLNIAEQRHQSYVDEIRETNGISAWQGHIS